MFHRTTIDNVYYHKIILFFYRGKCLIESKFVAIAIVNQYLKIGQQHLKTDIVCINFTLIFKSIFHSFYIINDIINDWMMSRDDVE